MLLPIVLLANNDRYRVIVNDDPATKITIAWNQTSGNNPTVHYGTTDLGTNYASYPFSQTVDRAVNDKGMENRFVRLTGLSPNTDYFFVINDSEGTSDRFWFRTAPSDNSRLSFIAGGDSRNNREPRQNANLLVSKLKPHAVFFGGDMTDQDTNAQWLNWFEDWQLTIASDGRMIPIVVARGNHESTTVIHNLFDTPTQDSYYATTFGNNLLRLYTLNSEISVTGDQQDWLEQDLAMQEDVIWKTAQYHRPMRPHTANKAENNFIYNAWAQIFFDENVRLVFESDSHMVKTTWPIEPSSLPGNDEGFIQNDSQGTIYTGEGCWGAPIRANNDDKSWTRNSGSFNQFKLIFVEPSNIELRTVVVNNAPTVGEVSNSDPFTLPANLEVFNPSNGSGDVVVITPVIPSPKIQFTSGTPTIYNNGTNLTFNIDIIDEPETITNIDFFVNDVFVMSDTAPPFSFTNSFANGSFILKAIATDINGITGETSIEIGVGNFTSSNTITISEGNDDVEERENGSISFNSSDLELVYDAANSNSGFQTIGLRFQEIDIPEGAKLEEVYLQFGTDEVSSAATSLLLFAEDMGDAQAFQNQTNNVSGRSKVSSSVAWNPPAWTTVNSSGTEQRSPNLKNLLQQVVNRTDWESKNSAVFIIEGTGASSTNTDARRIAQSFENAGSHVPQLEYTYSFDSSAAANTVSIAYEEGIDTNYTTGDNIELNVDVFQVGYGITKVEFFIDGILAFTDTTAPYSFNSSFSDGNYIIEAIATDESLRTSSDSIFINVGNFSTSDSVAIIDGNDDVEETAVGNMYFNSSDLEMVYDSAEVFDDNLPNGNQIIGLRFQNVNIPFGAEITEARIQFRSDEVNTSAASLLLFSENIGNAKAFEDMNKNISSRVRTSSQVAWSPASWGVINQVSTDQSTPDVKDLLQPIIDRCDWNTGNSVVFMIEGAGISLTNTNAKRVADSYEGSPEFAATLSFTYSYDSAAVVPNITEYLGSGIWTNGIPTLGKQAIFKESYDTQMGNIDACSCEIEANVTVNVGQNNYLKTENDILVNGTLNVENTGSIIQVDEMASTTNNGVIEIHKTTPPIEGNNFIVLSSPMNAETRMGVYQNAVSVFNTIPENFIPYEIDFNVYSEFEFAENFLDDNQDYIESVTQDDDLPAAGLGQLVFPALTRNEPLQSYDLNYTKGTLNSGNIEIPIHYNGPQTINNYNLLGNPYPSAISITDFILNNDAVNQVYFWEHITAPSNTLPGIGVNNFSMNDISVRNAMMGIAAVNGGVAPNEFMSSGQGFGIKADQSEASSNTPVIFTNAMRVTGNNSGLRSNNTPIDIDKMWLQLTSEKYSQATAQAGVGFTPLATEYLDKEYDSPRLGTFMSLFTILPTGEQLAIQGRESFDEDIKISLGFSTTVDEDSYTIRLENLEGILISDSPVYLIDHDTNTKTNLREEEYSFGALKGMYTERFTIVFADQEVLSTEENILDTNVSLYPNPVVDYINLEYTGPSTLTKVQIRDISGRFIEEMDLKDFSRSLKINMSSYATGIYFVDIQSSSQEVVRQIIKK